MKACVSCTAPVDPASRFCPSCGAAQGSGATPTWTPTVVSDRSVASSEPASGRRSRFVPGEILGARYRVEGLLGKGGMGEVYRAEDLKLGQAVALKFLPASLAGSPAVLARFHNEVRLARQVTHPNVCRVHDIGEVDGQSYITMEFVGGENLASLLRRIGRLPPDKTVEIARQLCAGLAAAHDRGVLHRDLKPENVMLDAEGRVRIMDFGLAGIREELTADDLRSGTPAYMAPEQLAGREVTVRSDIYALGLLIHEMYTGRRIFDAPSLDELKRQRESFVPQRTSTTGVEVDPAVDRVVRRCLDADPANRPASALAVALALPGGDPLRAALAAGEVPSPEMVAAAGATEGFRPWVAWSLFAFVVAALLLSGLALTRESVLGWISLERPPEALAERARQAVVAAGDDETAADEAWGFGRGVSALEWLQARGEPATRWDAIATGRLGAIAFWYRRAPRELTPANVVGRVTPDDPAPEAMSGDAVVVLDERGRLTSLAITPGQVLPEGGEARGEPDWGPLFALAGLDPAALSRTAPLWAPPVWADTTVAWSGRFPELPDAEVRVEAGAARGKIVRFEVIRPWDRPTRVAPRQPTLRERFIQNINIAIVVATLLGAAFVARRNLAAGRADSRGSWRLGAWAALATLGQWACFANHQASAAREWGLFIQGAGLSLFIGALVAILYLALEPLVRRTWPDVLISWTRLISGRWRDPTVARDALVGFTAASAMAAVAAVVALLQRAIGSPVRPTIPDLDGALGLAGWIGQMSGVQVNALVSPMVVLLVLVSARSLLKTTPRAVVVCLLVLGPLFALASMQRGGGVPFMILGVLQVGLIFFVLVRFGLLALVVSTLAGQIVSAFSWLADVGAWYWGFAAAAQGLILALAAGAALAASTRVPEQS